jgi:hypothetical protein
MLFKTDCDSGRHLDGSPFRTLASDHPNPVFWGDRSWVVGYSGAIRTFVPCPRPMLIRADQRTVPAFRPFSRSAEWRLRALRLTRLESIGRHIQAFTRALD